MASKKTAIKEEDLVNKSNNDETVGLVENNNSIQLLLDRVKGTIGNDVVKTLPEIASVMATLYALKIFAPTKVASSVSDIKGAFESISDRAINIVALKIDDINRDDESLEDIDELEEGEPIPEDSQDNVVNSDEKGDLNGI